MEVTIIEVLKIARTVSTVLKRAQGLWDYGCSMRWPLGSRLLLTYYSFHRPYLQIRCVLTRLWFPQVNTFKAAELFISETSRLKEVQFRWVGGWKEEVNEERSRRVSWQTLLETFHVPSISSIQVSDTNCQHILSRLAILIRVRGCPHRLGMFPKFRCKSRE